MDSGKGIPDFLVVVQGSQLRVTSTGAFVEGLAQSGVPVDLLHAAGLDHKGVNRAIGATDDELITPAIEAFLDDSLTSWLMKLWG